MGGGWLTLRHEHFPPGKRPGTYCTRLSGPQGRSEGVPEISPLPGLDPRTIQPAESRYIDYAFPARTFWGSTGISCHNVHLSPDGGLAPKICAPLIMTT